jgi:recombination protein RecA
MGISREGDILDLGVELNIVKKLGAFYSYGELRLGQGRENARAFLLDNPTLAAEIEALIREAAVTAPPVASNGVKAATRDEDEEDDVEEGAEV